MIYKFTDHINKYLKMLQTLQSSAFRVNETNEKKYLVIENIFGAAIVFFSGSNCQYCVQMRDVLDRTMPAFMSRVKFYTINLSENKDVVKKSEATFFINDTQKADIQHVPLVIFYKNGLPYRKFSGNYNVSEFSTFVEESLQEQAPRVPVQQAPVQQAASHYEQQPMQQPQQAAAYPAYPQVNYNGAYQNYGQQRQLAQQHLPSQNHLSQHQIPLTQHMPAAQHMMSSQHLPQRQAAASQQQSESISVNNCSNKKFCYLSFKEAYGN